MAQTGGGDLIGADPAVGGRDTPLRLHELRFEQALERRIERSFFHLEQVVRSLLDVLDERVPMGGLASKRLEDHHFECAGEEIARRGCFHRLYSDRHRLNKYRAFGKEGLRSLDGTGKETAGPSTTLRSGRDDKGEGGDFCKEPSDRMDREKQQVPHYASLRSG